MATADFSRINTNISAMSALNSLKSINTKLGTHQLRLATGKRINSAADDAAGLAIAGGLDTKARGLGQAIDNIGSAKNVMTTAEGHLNNVLEILNQMKTKSVQAANDTLGVSERSAILGELQKFNSQIDAEIGQADWFGTNMLTGTMQFQIGTGDDVTKDELTLDVLSNVSVTGLNSSGLDVVASSSATGSVTESNNVASGGISGTLDVSSTFNTLVEELGTGHYTMNASVTTNGTISIEVRDDEGNLKQINSDTDGATNYVGDSLVTTVAGGGNPAVIDLGVGITIDLGAISTASAQSLSIGFDYTSGGSSVSDQAAAQDFMAKIDTAIDGVQEALAYLGGQFNRLSFQEESLSVAKINTESSYSRIIDADMAEEQLNATKFQILQQTATAMLAQANSQPQAVLALFG
jgi:flagellin